MHYFNSVKKYNNLTEKYDMQPTKRLQRSQIQFLENSLLHVYGLLEISFLLDLVLINTFQMILNRKHV